MRVKAFFLTLLLLNFSQLYAQNNYGLRFRSKDVEKKYRTGLDITKSGAVSFDKDFNITFGLSFRSFEGFGYILRLKDSRTGAQLDLISKFDKVSPGMYLVYNKKEIEESIDLSKISNCLNRWNEVSLDYNAQTGMVKLTFNNDTISERINYPGKSEFFLAFGVLNKYGFDTREVPFISIRAINIYTDGKQSFNWPLNDQSGSISKDKIAGTEAEIINPEWELPHHAAWKALNSISLLEKPKIAYDHNKERIYMVTDHQKIYTYDLNLNHFDSIIYAGNPPLNEQDNQVIVTADSRLKVYSHAVDNLSVFDNESGYWSNQVEMHDSLPTHWHHNKLINPVNNKLTSICGYGFYRFKNDILEFNEDENIWQKATFSGDTIFPRYLSAVGQNPSNKDQFYLFGGLGNKSGDQMLGTRFYYDLYLIDFKTRNIRRIWDLHSLNIKDITPVNSLWVDEEQNALYTLCFSHHDEKSHLRILKASLTKPEYEFVGDSIPYYFIDVQSYADLFYWKSQRKLIAITSFMSGNNLNEIKIYSIQTPPGNVLPAVITTLPKTYIKLLTVLISVSVLLFILAIVFIYRRRSIKNKAENVAVLVDYKASGIKNPCKAEPAGPGSINLFGGLQVVDLKGQNITYRFSPTVKELFILILLYSSNDSNGISSVELREILWPGKPLDSANNNRGVNIAKLRSILSDLGDAEIIHENSFWRFKSGNTIFCDHTFVLKLINDNDIQYFTSEGNIYQLLRYLKRGDFLPDIQSEWIDKFKSETVNQIVSLLEMLLPHYESEKHPGVVLEIANSIFTFDQCNETALKYKCRALNHLGKHGIAVKTFDEFAGRYETLYGEGYKENIKNLLKD